MRAVKSCCFHCGCTLRNSKFFWCSGYQQDRQYCRDQAASNIEMTERFLTEEARQGSWQVLCGSCCSPDSSMWCLANIEQARNVRVIILARIRPQESNKLGKSGRGQIIARAMQGSKSEGSMEQLLPICCCSSSFREARVFAYGPLQIQSVPAVGWQPAQRFRGNCRTAGFHP